MSRTLTVSALFRDSSRSRRARAVRIPHLRLSGRWLELAGFPPGARIEVALTEGQLVLKKV